ncbi:EF-P lysine aminoacylase EpmA [Trichlorobacter lovleyi]|uniref:EF-P lysine aminoacylase EpmA n=1 Tax=Trichlorobacter lovleyi TaxID=313985 RepID=UPI0023F28B21|nr:EF-P lysine aminoacylase EpmA [Trichlorobacter lovleyi]
MQNSGALYIRAQVLQTIRRFFTERGFLEVETPFRIPANAPEEFIDPVPALASWQLQTSPEICMKRLLCRGYDKIFQICRCWRADERGSRHLTEFTMLEWYRSNADYHDLMQDCVGLLRQVADTCSEGACFKRNDLKIDPNQTWLHFSVQEAFLRFAKDDALVSAQNGLFEELLTDRIEPALEKFEVPVILQDYPAQLAALARLKTVAPDFAERFELYVGGLELANGFSELTDPFEQRARFEEANRIRQQMGKSELPLPEPFLAELSAMPPAAGIALGVDRLVMLTVGADCIDQVVAFTPESL